MADDLYTLPAGGRIRAAGLYPVWLVGIYGGIFVAAWVSTQWVAHQWGYHPSLGPGWFRVGGITIYPPWQFVGWWWMDGHVMMK